MKKTALFKKFNKVFPLFVLLFLAAFLRIWLSSGIGGSDDVVYLTEAYKCFSGTYETPTYIAQLRIGTILPIALMFKLFGVNSYTIYMWPLMASLINIVVIYLIAFQLFDRRIALFASLCASFFPLDIHTGGVAMTETSLILMLSFSVLFYLLAFKSEKQHKKVAFYVLSGFFVGLSALNKHPALMILFFFAVHSILNNKSWAFNFLYIPLGGFVVFIFENIYLYFVSGDPLFLYHMFSKVMEVNRQFYRINQPLMYYPYYMLFSLQHVGLYFYLALSGMLYFFLNKKKEQTDVTGIKFVLIWGFSLIGIMTFLPISISPLIFIPKQTNYMMMFCVPFIILSGYSLSLIRKKQLMYVSIIILCLTSVFCAYFQRNTTKSHSHNMQAAFEHIAKHPESVLITGEFNTHYCMIYNMLNEQKIEYYFFDEIINGKINKAQYTYKKRPDDDQYLIDAINKYDKVLVLYDSRMAKQDRQKNKYYYPDPNIFLIPENNFKLIATIKKESNKLEQIMKPVLTNLVRIIENYGFGSNIAKKIRGLMKDVFDLDPAYLFMKEQKQ